MIVPTTSSQYLVGFGRTALVGHSQSGPIPQARLLSHSIKRDINNVIPLDPSPLTIGPFQSLSNTY